MYASCGADVTERLKTACDKTELKQTIVDNKGSLRNSMSERDIGTCLNDECEIQLAALVEQCYLKDIQYQMYDSWGCRIYNILWHCVKSGLPSGTTCSDKVIRSHLFVKLYKPYDYFNNQWTNCTVTAERPVVCNDTEMIIKLTENTCYRSFEMLRKTCSDSTRNNATECVESIIRRFAETCDDDTVKTQAIMALVKKDRMWGSSLVEECFEDIGRDGFCPLQQTASVEHCRVCDSWEHDECVIDVGCPEQTKCCHDGCSRKCLPVATQPITLESTVLLREEMWKDEYYNPQNAELQAIVVEYQPVINELMEFLGDSVSTVSPNIMLRRSYSAEDGKIEAHFEYESFVDMQKIDQRIKEFFRSNENIEFFYTFVKPQDTPEKEGTCPSHFFYEEGHSYCCSDNSCSGDMKCCENGFRERKCVTPYKEKLEQCNNTEVIQDAQPGCGLDLGQISTYTCGVLFTKMKCVLDSINQDRPEFTDCLIGNLRDTINRTLLTDANWRKLYDCREFELQITVEIENCNTTSPAFIRFKDRMDNVTANLDGFRLRQAFCRYQKYRNRGRFYSYKNEYILQEEISQDLNDDIARRRRQAGEDLMPYVDVKPVNWYRNEWCGNEEVSKRFWLACAKEKAFVQYEDYRKCGPAFEFFDCVKDKYWRFEQRQTDSDCEMPDEVFIGEVLPYLQTQLEDTEMNKKYLEKLQMYNPTTCVDQDSDMDPCYDKSLRDEAYSSCAVEIPVDIVDGVFSQESCRQFYKLSSCVTVRLRSYGSWCDFNGTDEFVYRSIRDSYTNPNILSEYYDGVLMTCEEYKPVCSAAYISNSRHNKCGQEFYGYGRDMKTLTCSEEDGRMIFKRFISCLAIHALFMKEDDCTVSKIIDIINEDLYQLGMFNETLDINICLPAEAQNALENELIRGDNLCTSSIFVNYVANSCFMMDEHSVCRNMKDINSSASCSFLTQVMTCAKQNISHSVGVECNMGDLIKTEMPENSLFSVPGWNRSGCAEKVEYKNCVKDALSENFFDAMHCTKASISSANFTYGSEARHCRMLEYTLTCLKSLVPTECTYDSDTQIYDEYISLLEYLAVDRSIRYCYDYHKPDPFPKCDVPTTLPVGGNNCSNENFVTDIVIGYCGREFTSRTAPARGNATVPCLVYSELLDCGVNATQMFLPVMDKGKMFCMKEEVNNALQENSDTVKAALSVNPKDCQDVDRDGFCPLQLATAICRVCPYNETNECVIDSSCPNGTKCCTDGCIMKCLPKATQPIALETTVVLMNEIWKEYYNVTSNLERNILVNKYQGIVNNLMESLNWYVDTDIPDTTFRRSYKEDGKVELAFQYHSYVDQYKMESMIKEYFIDNMLNIRLISTVIQSSDKLEKEGTCPSYSFDNHNRYQSCCSDYSCSGDMKCCQFDYYQYSCVPPIKGDVKKCNNTDIIEGALPECNLDLENIASYSCGDLFMKMECVLDRINEGRPQFTDCVIGNLRDTIKSLLPPNGRDASAQRLFDCKKFELQISVELENCNTSTPEFKTFKDKMDAAHANLGDFRLKQAFCRFKKYKNIGRFSSDEEDTLREQIYQDFKENENENNTRKRRQAGTTLIPDIDVTRVDLYGRDWCNNAEMLQHFGLQCAKENVYMNYDSFRRCSPAFDFFDCIKRKTWDLPMRDTYKGCEMPDELFKALLPYLRTKLEFTERNMKYVDKLEMYNPETCVDRSSDKDPCYDDILFEDAYNSCGEKYSVILDSGVFTPDNCREFYKLSSCVAVKLRGFGSQCSFYTIEDFVYIKIRYNYTYPDMLPHAYYMLKCEEYKPVCSASYISGSGVVRTREYNPYGIDASTCSNAMGRMMFKRFISGLAIDALFMKEEDCTVSKIIEIINKDIYQLSMFNGTVNTTMCLPVEAQNDLDQELTLGPDLCTSGIFVEHVAQNCVQIDEDNKCYGRTLEHFNASASCSFLTHVMGCTKQNITKGIGIECSLDNLISTKMPENSTLTVPDSVRSNCTKEIENDNCVRDAFMDNFHDVMHCTKASYISMNFYEKQDGKHCRMLKYTLTCLKFLIPTECTFEEPLNENDSLDKQIYLEFVKLLEYMEVERNVGNCYNKSQPRPFSECDAPAALPSEGNDCSDPDFVNDVVIGHCAKRIANRTSVAYGNEAALCLAYSELLNCGVNATKLFLPRNGDKETSCSRAEVNDALQEKSDAVKEALGVSPSDCQGECYLDMEETVNDCVNLTLGLGQYYDHMAWKRTCRAYHYAYQCINQAKPDCNADLKKMALDTAIEKYEEQYRYKYCEDPRYAVQLDMCSNLTDLIEVSGSCEIYVRFLVNSSVNVQSAGQCKNQTDLIDCMNKSLETFMGIPADPEEEICGFGTSEIIGKASLLIAQRMFRYDSQDLGMHLATVKACFGMEDRPGFCPYIENMYTPEGGISNCAGDDDCKDSEHKCCYNGSALTCRAPYTIRELFEVMIKLYDVEFEDVYEDDWYANETQEMIAEHLEWVEDICTEQGWECDDFRLERNKMYYRKRRQTSDTITTTNMRFNVKSFNSPKGVLQREIKMDNKNYDLSVDFSPRETEGMCPMSNSYGNCSSDNKYCYNDHQCRVTHGYWHKCCDHDYCGNRCVNIGDPDKCKPLFDDFWDECTVDIDLKDFESVLSYEQWNKGQCSDLDSISRCITDKDKEKMCSYSFFSDQAFKNIIWESDKNPDNYGYPKECAEQPETNCRDFNSVYERVQYKCDKDIDEIFNREETSKEKCRAYKEFKDCIKAEMSECYAEDLDEFIDDQSWTFFWRFKEDGRTEEKEWFNLEHEKCESNLCWSEKLIVNTTIGHCRRHLTPLSGKGQMTKDICMNVLELTKCVTDELHRKMWQMSNTSSSMSNMSYPSSERFKCERKEIQNSLLEILHKEDLEQLITDESFDFSSLNFEFCEEMVCYPPGLASLAKEGCEPAWEQYMADRNCIHFQMYMGCVKTNAMNAGENCTFRDILHLMRTWGGEGLDVNPNRTFSMCPACQESWDVAEGVKVNWTIYREDVGFTIWASNEKWSQGRWIGFGLSDDNFMPNTDIVTFEWSDTDNIVLKNRFASGKSKPAIDNGPHNYKFWAGTDEGGSYVTYWRSRYAIDTAQDKVVNGSKYLLVAVGDLDSSSDITYHAGNKWSSPSSFNFDCSNEEAAVNKFEAEFPKNFEDMCPYWGINHYHLRYTCASNMDARHLSHDDQCIYEEYAVGCMNEQMQQYGCTFEQTKGALANPETVEGIFDPDLNCGAVWESFNDCDYHILYAGKSVTDRCFSAIAPFTQFKMFGKSAEDIKNPEEDKPLMCSLMENAIGCFMTLKPYNGEECNATSFKNVVNKELDIYQKVSMHQMNATAAPQFTPVDFSTCDIAADLTINYDECPPANTIVEQLTAQCFPSLYSYKNNQPLTASLCSWTPILTICYQHSYNIRLAKCDNREKSSALLEYDDYIYDVSGGYSLKNCSSYGDCIERLSGYTDCTYKYSNLHLLAPQMSFTQKCTLLAHYRPETKMCLEGKDAACDKDVEAFIVNAIDMSEPMRNAFPDREKCSEDDIDMCQSVKQLGVMECGWFMLDTSNDNFNCLMRDCFERLNIPEKCGPYDRQLLAEETIRETYSHEVGPCEGYTKSPCDDDYFNTAVTDTCKEAWNYYDLTKDCKEYEDFLVCIRYMAVTSKEYCTIQEIHNKINGSVKEKGLPAEICPGSDFNDLERRMANDRKSVCYNPPATAYLLKYYCIPANLDYFNQSDDTNRCMIERRIQHCVFAITSTTAGCTDIQETADAFNSTDVQTALGNPGIHCDSEFPCQTYMMLDIVQSAKKVCLQNTRSILYIPDLHKVEPFGENLQDISFPCMIYEQSALCVSGIYRDKETAVEDPCPGDQFDASLQRYLPELINSLVIDGQYAGMPEPKNDASSIYAECNVKVFPLDADYDCLDGDQIINTVTASCAPYVMGVYGGAETVAEQCRMLSACIEGMIEWHKTYNVCEGYIDALMEAKMNTTYAAYFQRVTGLDWTKCEDEPGHDELYKVVMGLINEPFQDDFNDLDSLPSRELIERIKPFLDRLILTNKGWLYKLLKLSSSEFERRKRQEPPVPELYSGITYVFLEVTADENPEARLRAAIESDNDLTENFEFKSAFIYEVDCGRVLCGSPDCSTREGQQCCDLCKNPVCAAVSCLEPDCDNPFTPEGECCPQCPEEPSPCTAEYFDIATQYNCNPSWEYYKVTSNCNDYVQFLSCVWYQDLARNGRPTCTLQEVHDAMKNKTIWNAYPARICDEGEGLTLEYVTSVFATTRKEICLNWYINRHLLEYYCLGAEANYKDETDTKESCLSEFRMRRCVNSITSEVGCYINSTSYVFNDERLRRDLLKNETCDTDYPCERYTMLDVGKKLTDRCLGSAVNLLYMKSADSLMGYNHTVPFRCVTYKYTAQCVYREFSSEPEFTCDPEELHPSLLYLIHMKATSNEEMEPLYEVQEIFSDCRDKLSTNSLADCPAEEELVTMVTAACGIHVIKAMQEEEYGSTEYGCRALQGCFTGMTEWYRERRMCVSESNDIKTRLENMQNNKDYAEYFQNATGFNWFDCPFEKSTHRVILGFPDDVYSQEYADINSPAAQNYIAFITQLLNQLFEGRSFRVTRLYTSARTKRQTDGSGVKVEVEVDGSGITLASLRERAADLEIAVRVESVIPVNLPCKNGPSNVSCFAAPCDVNRCPNYPDATCMDNYCEGCNAQFYYNGSDVSSLCHDEDHKRCELPEDRGNCKEERLYWFYNMEKMMCEQFYYTGCAGNKNRFNTKEQCEHFCQDECSGECAWYEMCNNGQCQCGDMCTADYAPVFCNNGTHTRNFSNQCTFKMESCREGEPFKPEDCSEPSCYYDGKIYENGDSFMDKDDCNRCFCSRGSIGCTEMYCPPGSYRVILWFGNDTYNADYANISSPAAREFIASITPLLDLLFDGWSYEVIKLSTSARTKRQTEEDLGVRVEARVRGTGVTQEKLVEREENLDDEFRGRAEVESVTQIDNECNGECAWYEECYNGQCQCGEMCTEEYAPVICNNGTHTRNFSNQCTFKMESCWEGEPFKPEDCTVCAAVSCLEPDCDYPFTPEGECCPQCPEEPSPCTAEYFDIARQYSCNPSWEYYKVTSDCNDYVQFLSCVWYQDLARNGRPTCTLQEVHDAMKNKTIWNAYPARICDEGEGLTLEYVTSVFATTRKEICLNWYINRHLLEYYCLGAEANYKDETDTKESCLSEFRMRRCVNSITSEVGCYINSTSYVFNDERLRRDLLKNETCDTDYPCERYTMLDVGKKLTDRCLGSAVNLLYMKSAGSLMGYNHTVPFRCVTYKYTAQCVYREFSSEPEFTCDPEELHPSLLYLIHMKATSNEEMEPLYEVQEIFSDCRDKLSTNSLADCPAEGEELVNMVTAACGIHVIKAMQEEEYGSTEYGCRALQGCFAGITEWYRERRMCVSESNDIKTRLENMQNNKDYAEYFQEATGLNWFDCPSEISTGCDEILRLGWTDELRNLHSLMADKEKCRILINATWLVLNATNEKFGEEDVMSCLLNKLSETLDTDELNELGKCVENHYRHITMQVIPERDWDQAYNDPDSKELSMLKRNVTSVVTSALRNTNISSYNRFILIKEVMSVDDPENPGKKMPAVNMQLLVALPAEFSWPGLQENLLKEAYIRKIELGEDSHSSTPQDGTTQPTRK
ncbi:uncharacterized protein LOC123546327 isoform X2 [Mercenaria mercenaria]|uniref:uncharacterized protein LOC123546327 isoform X2 n=1 Tax=Mercenaria mercenaria TaxID=6596 RepID=UPI00234F37A0|nr:uncharacterized protein LOC123546327 isoform X2 [Mercenaria mercenaria]